MAPRMPGWLRAMGFKPMSLGLDLRGGVYFLYEVDVAGAVKQLIASMERDYRTLLRDERIPYTGIQADGRRRRAHRPAQRCRRGARVGRAAQAGSGHHARGATGSARAAR